MRFSILDPERMSGAQKRAYDAIVSGPRGGARGPFNVLLRSPELADRVQRSASTCASARRCRPG
jgi:4-carboxymuconolactone decarboxylase